MKIKTLLILAMCAVSFGMSAQTLMFHETFGANEHHDGGNASAAGNNELTANHNAAFTAYKPAANNFYFAEKFQVHGDWGAAPDYAGNGGAPVLGIYGYAQHPDVLGTPPGKNYDEQLGSYNNYIDHNIFRIQIKTSSMPYAALSYGHSINAWNANSSSIKVSYSFGDENWVEFKKEDATVIPGTSNRYELITHIENIGGKELVYIKFEGLIGSAMIDDVKVTGYNTVPVFKNALEGAINDAVDFMLAEMANPAYCSDALANLNDVSIVAAQDVFDNAAATQAQVDAAVSALNSALTAIKASVLDLEAATTAEETIATFKATAAYTDGSKALKDAFDAAATALQTIVSDGEVGGNCATQANVDAAIVALETAKTNLSEHVSIDGSSTESVVLFPNPATDYIIISGIEGNVYIFNAAGQQVKSVTNYNGEAIGISELASGIYSAVSGKSAISFIKK